jgi:putative phosphoesterase
MRLLIVSDIHGDFSSAEKIAELFEKGKFDKILCLGDVLYHGPRNDLPDNYAPKKVIPLLNSYADKIISVRGNCDAEVDGMVLDFSVSKACELLCVDGVKIFATHGHIYSAEKLPEDIDFDLFIQGHTHLYGIENLDGNRVFLNPGSITLPKGNNKRSYATFENGLISVFDFDGNLIISRKMP